MVCKNCGARLKENATRCSNCGTIVESQYTIDITKYASPDTLSEKYLIRKRRRRFFKIFVAIILVLALGLGSFFFFDYLHENKSAPDLYFESGTGIINDEKIVYLVLNDATSLEFIHGVKLYDGDITKPLAKKSDPISTDYQYTKSAEDSIRSIFFYTDDLGVKEGKNYTYTFEMTFGFADDTNFYTYQQVVDFSGDINDDISDFIFDHSLKEEIPSELTTSTTEPDTTATTQQTNEPVDMGFIYNSFWFTEPYTEVDKHYISCWKFNQGGTISVTSYTYANGKWETRLSTIKFTIDGNKLNVDDGEGEISTFVVNSKEFSIKQVGGEYDNVEMELTSRKYNSISNVEDFFGM